MTLLLLLLLLLLLPPATTAAAAAAAARPLPQVSQLPYLSVDELMGAPTTSQEGAFGAFNMPVSVWPYELYIFCTRRHAVLDPFWAVPALIVYLMGAPTTSQEGAFGAFNMPVSDALSLCYVDFLHC
jgi:hypothetical protein